MRQIPLRLRALGWNRRVLTLDDFHRVCRRERILVTDAPLAQRGRYFEVRGVPIIALNERLRGHEKTLVAFHELAHWYFHVPGFYGVRGKTELEADVIAHCALIPVFLLNLPDGEIAEMFGYPDEMITERVKIFRTFNL